MKCYRKYIKTNLVLEMTLWTSEEFAEVIESFRAADIGIWEYYIQ